ncbi:unnamed protein product [Haemonchus placei]|uniref:Uncharacterized protein n=1 Tax=Haemonchus placei TaxID=6290 RepID=A0A0N4WRM3_HAEPC|nr:unnamed protein product [Haemonchus placei]
MRVLTRLYTGNHICLHYGEVDHPDLVGSPDKLVTVMFSSDFSVDSVVFIIAPLFQCDTVAEDRELASVSMHMTLMKSVYDADLIDPIELDLAL